MYILLYYEVDNFETWSLTKEKGFTLKGKNLLPVR